MRRILGLGFTVLLAAGCASGPFARNNVAPQTYTGGPPRVEQVITHLNQQCRPIHSVEFHNVSINLKQGSQTMGVNGMLAYEKPRNFRLQASAALGTLADVGSNSEEFWFWFKEGEAPLYRCAHSDLARVRNLAIPVHPDWIAEALCVQEFGSPEQYQTKLVGQKIELTSQTTGPQGQPLQKVTTVALAGPEAGRVIAQQVRTPQGTEVYSASITEYRTQGGYVLPRKVTVKCPAQNVELAFKLDGVKVNQVAPGAQTFARPGGYQVIDLARGPAPAATPQSIQRVRGQSR